MKCNMGHFGQPLDSEKLVQEREFEAQPAMLKFDSESYFEEDPMDEFYYAPDELGPQTALSKQLEAEAQTAEVKKTDVASAAAASAPSPTKPKTGLILGGIAALGALWYMNQD